MNREEIETITKIVVHAVVNANVELARMADSMIEKALSASTSGRFMPGLVFKVEADEVRKMLRKRAEALRSLASSIESTSISDEQKKKILESLPEYLQRDDASLENAVREIEENMAASVLEKREEANRLDWQAQHFDDRSYVLSAMDLDLLMPLTSRTYVPSRYGRAVVGATH